jgi:nicotinate-nucleotide pyrophosphorylase (carboxylating)
MVEATAEQIAKARRVAFLASRTNTLLSIPMLMSMVEPRSRRLLHRLRPAGSDARMNALPTPRPMSPPLPGDIAAVVAAALAEDVGAGDLTADLIDQSKLGRAQVIVREPAILCGCSWFDETFRQIDRPDTCLVARLRRGGHRHEFRRLRSRGPARGLLTGERTALNFLQTLSATANGYARAREHPRGHRDARARHSQDAAGTPARAEVRRALRRRREPSARPLRRDPDQGEPHRGGRRNPQAVEAARKRSPRVPLEVEVENLAELAEALDTAADRIMLDDFSLADVSRRSSGATRIPASARSSRCPAA